MPWLSLIAVLMFACGADGRAADGGVTSARDGSTAALDGARVGDSAEDASAEDASFDDAGVAAALHWLHLSVGYGQMCGLDSDGFAHCWLFADPGQPDRPKPVVPNVRFKALALQTYGYTCGLREDDTVLCWGEMPGSLLEAPPSEPLTALSASDVYMCGLRQDGSIVCWGPGANTLKSSKSGFAAVQADSFGVCGLTSSGRVDCSGLGDPEIPSSQLRGSYRQFDNGCGVTLGGNIECTVASSKPPAGTFREVHIAGLLNSNAPTACALAEAGSITCWGLYDDAPRWQPPGQDFIELTAGESASCAIRRDGRALCWKVVDIAPWSPPTDLSLVQVSAGFQSACGIDKVGAIHCWGDAVPKLLDAPAGSFRSVCAGQFGSCAVRADNTMVCWDVDIAVIPTPMRPNLTDLREVDMEYNFGCALRGDGSLVCWTGDATPPNPLPPSGVFSTMSVGSSSGCAIEAASGALQCWARPCSNPPDIACGDLTKVPAGRFTQVSASVENACAVRDDGTVLCWGQRFFVDAITQVPPGVYKEVGMSSGHACAIRQDGTLACWPRPASRAFDDTPWPPAGKFTQLSVSESFDCAVREDSSVVCWPYEGIIPFQGLPEDVP